MIPTFRHSFNTRYTPAQYERLLTILEETTGSRPSFRVAETPCFLPKTLLDQCSQIGAELTHRLVEDRAYLEQAEAAIPANFRMPGLLDRTAHPNFMTADFGLVREPDGRLTPQIVELQAFPSVYAYQSALAHAYHQAFELPGTLGIYLNGHSEDSYFALLKNTILGSHSAEHVALVEVTPEQQKTWPDFALTQSRLGIPIVDIARLVIRPDPSNPDKPAQIFRHARPGDPASELIPVHRIYNRAIADEIAAKNIQLPFRYNQPLAVEWAHHPNWYFAISKFSLPHLTGHPNVPAAYFLNDWFERTRTCTLPPDLARLPRSEWILKPLYAFAGKGILFNPSDEDLAQIPRREHPNYLMQRRCHFAPVIETPFGPTQTEIRILYLWPDNGQLEPVITLTRLGRGQMMGVDHNRDQEWVGGSAALWA